MSPSARSYEYRSTVRVTSGVAPGVEYEILRMSVRRRSQLAREILTILPKLEFCLAGASAEDKLQAAQYNGDLREIYLRWGLVSVAGLSIDCEPATIDSLISRGPEDLCQEIVAAIQSVCGLNEQERKN